MKTSLLTFSLIGLFSFSADAWGNCMRLVQVPHLPEPDGPGAFSPLQDTLSLDCLVFTGTTIRNKEIVALVQDERGVTYTVARGDFLGENNGRVSEITEQRITVKQLVHDANGDWAEVLRYVFLGQDNRI